MNKKNNTKTKWLMYTVIVGLIPILCRALIWSLNNTIIEPIASTDIIMFGIVLHISNINEVEHSSPDRNWKTVSNSTSILFIVFYSILLCLSLLSQKLEIQESSLIICTLLAAMVSLLLGYMTHDSISKLTRAKR